MMPSGGLAALAVAVALLACVLPARRAVSVDRVVTFIASGEIGQIRREHRA